MESIFGSLIQGNNPYAVGHQPGNAVRFLSTEVVSGISAPSKVIHYDVCCDTGGLPFFTDFCYNQTNWRGKK